MRYLILLNFLLFFNGLIAQPGTGTDEIFIIVEEMPRFPGCEDMTGTIAEKEACSKEKLLSFIYENIAYPDSALIKGIDGSVVVRFVVNKEGRIINDTILKDIGGGCGEEALRTVKLMNEMPERWIPGKKANEPVNVYYTLPIKFKLTEPVVNPDFVYLNGDSIWVQLDEAVDFEGGAEAFGAYMAKNLKYPFVGNIDCEIGMIEVKTLIRSDGSVKIMDITDYSSLGFDFWYEAIDFIHKSQGKWKAGTFRGRQVNATYDVKLVFKPDYGCEDVIENFSKATEMVEEAIQLFEAEELEKSIEKFNSAVELFPDNAEFLALRGQAFIEANRLAEACQDFSKVRDLLYVAWYDQYLPFICK